MPTSSRFNVAFRLAPGAIFAIGFLSALGCSQITLVADYRGDKDAFEPPPAGSGGAGLYSNNGGAGGEGGTSIATSGGTGAGSFGHLCGGSAAMCTPGTDDCTLGGDPNMGGGSPDQSKVSCQLTASGAGVEAKCGPAGAGGLNFPCASVADCQAGLGCVISDGASVCRPYCCGDVDECGEGTYCAPAPMAESDEAEVPVCLAASYCVLLNDKTCKNGQTCTIVRDDGTTSCVDPGPGVAGDACPCAAGHYCAPASGTCLKLCHTDSNAECGADGKCQGGVEGLYPPGFGVCVTY